MAPGGVETWDERRRKQGRSPEIGIRAVDAFPLVLPPRSKNFWNALPTNWMSHIQVGDLFLARGLIVNKHLVGLDDELFGDM